GRRSELVRDLPGTGSKACARDASGTTEVTCFGAASQPSLPPEAPTPCGQKTLYPGSSAGSYCPVVTFSISLCRIFL
ncbi:hypothetical protein GIV81_24660, partial [Pseudomonas syringae]|nr:hypothetical protein [Pseudomonas syringae]